MEERQRVSVDRLTLFGGRCFALVDDRGFVWMFGHPQRRGGRERGNRGGWNTPPRTESLGVVMDKEEEMTRATVYLSLSEKRSTEAKAFASKGEDCSNFRDSSSDQDNYLEKSEMKRKRGNIL